MKKLFFVTLAREILLKIFSPKFINNVKISVSLHAKVGVFTLHCGPWRFSIKSVADRGGQCEADRQILEDFTFACYAKYGPFL